jgi:hypothetical protein
MRQCLLGLALGWVTSYTKKKVVLELGAEERMANC